MWGVVLFIVLVLILAYLGEPLHYVSHPMSGCDESASNRRQNLIWLQNDHIGFYWYKRPNYKFDFVVLIDVVDSQVASATFYPTDSRIFSSWHLPSQQLFSNIYDEQAILKLDLQTLEESVVIEKGGGFANPTLSPDETRLAYFSKDELYIQAMPISWWTRPKPLTKSFSVHTIGNDINWHPQQKWVAYTSSAEEADGYRFAQIFLVDIEDYEVQILTELYDCSFEPRWSVDGQELAYISTEVPLFRPQSDIFLRTMNNGQVVNLTKTDQMDEYMISWSPDGRKILYVGRPTADEMEQKVSDIFMIDIETRQQTQLTFTPELNEWMPAWSPDGLKIAFFSQSTDSPYNNGTRTLEILDLATMERFSFGDVSSECLENNDCFTTP